MSLAISISAPISNGIFWACFAAVGWLPLSASYRKTGVRRRRFMMAIALTALAMPAGLLLQSLTPDDLRIAPDRALVWWLAGFVATSLLILGSTVVLRLLGGRGGYTSPSLEDDRGEVVRWRRAPPAIALIVMIVAGAGYQLAVTAPRTHQAVAAGLETSRLS